MPEKYVPTTVSWYEREALSNLPNGEETWKVKGPWVYIAGARESDFTRKKKPKTRRPDTEKAAASNLGVIRFERMVDGSWVYVAGARESDFRKQEGKKHGAEKPAPPKPETEEPETEKSAPSKLEQEQEQFQELSVEGEGEGDAAGGERPVSDDGQDHEELDHEQPDQEQLDQEQPDWDSWEWEQGDEGYVSEQSQDRLALLEQEVAQLLEEVQFLEEQDQDQG